MPPQSGVCGTAPDDGSVLQGCENFRKGSQSGRGRSLGLDPEGHVHSWSQSLECVSWLDTM